jgi:Glycosyl hydrolase family 26
VLTLRAAMRNGRRYTYQVSGPARLLPSTRYVRQTAVFTDDDARLTRREVVKRGSLALVLASSLGRLLLNADPAFAALAPRPCAIGAYVNPHNAALTTTGAQRATVELESMIERQLQVVSTFVGWDEVFPNARHVLDRDSGRIPLIAWDGRSDLAAVRSGEWDDLLRQRAEECRAFGGPIYLRWAPEFNGEWNPCYGRQRDFVPAWQRVVRTFKSVGATNVQWVWCPFATGAERRPASDWRTYYPGDSFVDWIGMDGYNWGTARSWSKWQSFEEIFAPLYADYAGRKPLMICEIACAEDGGEKPAWIRHMGSALQERFSKVKALVWFNTNKETDWRVNSSAASLAAFRSLVAQPRFA